MGHPTFHLSVVKQDTTKRRYYKTTAIILKKNKFCKEVAVKYDPRLRERKYGIAEGRPLSNLKAMATAAGEQCPSFTPPGGETLEEVKARGKDFFEYLCSLVAKEAHQEKQTSPRTKEANAEMGEGGCPTSLINHCSGLESVSDPECVAEVLAANILVVSHGAYMRNWINYFISDCECTLPITFKKTELSCVSPNTGISQFTIKLEMRENIKPKIHCISLNKSDHLDEMTAEKI
uniref:Fructose-2,6-bisphosphatase TIGAR n=1 Tax=Salvator merianae TaxID=96440 RepID=A0A8D0KPA2_SALMN